MKEIQATIGEILKGYGEAGLFTLIHKLKERDIIITKAQLLQILDEMFVKGSVEITEKNNATFYCNPQRETKPGQLRNPRAKIKEKRTTKIVIEETKQRLTRNVERRDKAAAKLAEFQEECDRLSHLLGVLEEHERDRLERLRAVRQEKRQASRGRSA